MRHTTTIKRPNGDRYEIIASLWLDSLNDKPKWDVTVSFSAAGKRKFAAVGDFDSYTYRNLAMNERRKYEMNTYLQHVTAEEILSAKLALWELIKPE